MKKKCLILIYAFLFSLVAVCQNITVSGYITDAKNGETLISASIFDSNSSKGTVTNSYGFYSLTIPKGVVNIQYSYVGYSNGNAQFKLSKDTVINIRLHESTELQEVVVVGSRKEIGVKGSQMSAIEVPISQIKSIPSLFGETDVIKALQLLPGVKSGTEGSAQMLVRGGGPDENLFLLDGVPVYNVNHAGGFFSLFNADALKTVTLYKGSYPARFGGRLSSVVDIRMKDGDDKKIHGNVTVGLISSKINIEGPIIKEKTTFNFSARRTYADILAQPIIKLAASQSGATNASAGYYFYDLNAKINHKFSDNDRLYLSTYMGDDVIYADIKENNTSYDTNTSSNRIKLDWSWGNLISALRWNHIINNKLFVNSTVTYSRYRFYMGIGTESETISRNPVSTTSESISMGYKSGIEDYSAKMDFDWSPNPNHDVKFGANYTNHTFRPGVTVFQSKPKGDSIQQLIDTTITIGNQNVYSHETMAYFEDNISINSVIKANIGLHYSNFLVQDEFYQSLQPRLGLRALLNDKLSIKAGYAAMSQYIHLLSNSNISLPTDLWVPVTKRIAPMKSEQYSAGVFYNLKNLIDLSVEGYYKSMDNLIEYVDGASFLGSSTGWEDKVSMGRGWAYGIEFLAQKSIGNTTGWIGYTWSKSERLFDREGQVLNNGIAFPSKYDRRHDFSFVVSHKFSDRFDIGVTWVYSTGSCGTLAMQNYGGTDIPQSNKWNNYGYDYSLDPQKINPITTTLPYVSSRNNFRYEPYHRMDIGVNFHKQLKHGRRTINISVYNVYNQLNPFITMASTKNDYSILSGTNNERKVLTQYSLFPIIPSVSYTYKF
jgi:uncharacterized protein YerC